MNHNIPISATFTPVSYTHLDVYKRQVDKRVLASITMNAMCEGVKIEVETMPFAIFHLRGQRIVSDVYKRQRLESSI